MANVPYDAIPAMTEAEDGAVAAAVADDDYSADMLCLNFGLHNRHCLEPHTKRHCHYRLHQLPTHRNTDPLDTILRSILAKRTSWTLLRPILHLLSIQSVRIHLLRTATE